jgi:hypothetical protein
LQKKSKKPQRGDILIEKKHCTQNKPQRGDILIEINIEIAEGKSKKPQRSNI